jgi:hypothetical protein
VVRLSQWIDLIDGKVEYCACIIRRFDRLWIAEKFSITNIQGKEMSSGKENVCWHFCEEFECLIEYDTFKILGDVYSR